MTVDVDRLQGLLDEYRPTMHPDVVLSWVQDLMASETGLLVVVAERDKLAAQVEAVRGMVGRFDRVTEVSGGRYDEGHVAGFHLAATIILAALDGDV